MRTKEGYKISLMLHETEAKLAYTLDVFGDEIAKRQGYKELSGMDAIHFYIIHKFKWLPSQVKSMSTDDLRFLLTEEIVSWILPKEALL